MKHIFIFFVILLFTNSVLSQKRSLSFDDLFSMKRISSPQISPDGKKVVYTVKSYDIDSNKGQSDLYITDINNGKTTQLTSTKYSESNPRWSKSGKKIAFLSTKNGNAEIFTLNPESGESILAATIPVSISHFEWSSNYDGFVFIADVYPEARNIFESMKGVVEKAGGTMDNIVSTTVYVRDMFRHRPIVNELYEEYFKDNLPTRTIVEISRLNGDDNIEITASVAYIS